MTRCVIAIKKPKGAVYKIYRRNDGSPKDVLSDLKVMWDKNYRPLSDPEYFLANFIFLAKISFLKFSMKYRGCLPLKPWLGGYGVCSSECDHGVDYKYTIYGKRKLYKLETGTLFSEMKTMIKIEEWNDEKGEWVTIYDGTIEGAFEKWKVSSQGCHLKGIQEYL